MDKSNRLNRRKISVLLGFTVIGLLVVAAVSGPVAAHTGDNGVHHHDGWMGSHGGMDGWIVGGFGFGWMLLWTILLIGIPVALVYLLLTRRETAETTDEDALTVLRKRYAEGEIDEDEFDERSARLTADNP